MIEIQDNSETVEVEVFKLPEKVVELEVEEPVKEEPIDPLDAIAQSILDTVNGSDENKEN